MFRLSTSAIIRQDMDTRKEYRVKVSAYKQQVKSSYKIVIIFIIPKNVKKVTRKLYIYIYIYIYITGLIYICYWTSNINYISISFYLFFSFWDNNYYNYIIKTCNLLFVSRGLCPLLFFVYPCPA